jgi:aspartyl-tRNA(Asn)/glutamyl-tRNA(Gln) amidotransferase subunit A
MPVSDELCYLTIGEAARLIEGKDLSPVELTRAHLERIERLDGRLGCYITVAAESALEEARAAEREIAAGRYLGPLHGIPIAHKDNLATAGLRTTAATRVHADWVPAEDAASVARLRAAGTVLLGKLMLSEFAFGYADPDGALFREARNPWNTRHVPGGSSSGSAAGLAAGLLMGSLGGDTGGSIRGPAANNNVVGLKPTYDLVSRAGAFPAAWSLDHVGPMTRTVRDNAIMLKALAGDDGGHRSEAPGAIDYTAQLERGAAGLKVGVPATYLESLPGFDPDVSAVFAAALVCLEELGAQVVPIEIEHLETDLIEAVYWTILRAEVFAAHRSTLLSRPEDYGRLLRRRVRLGALVTAEEYLLAQRGRSLLRRGLARAFDEVDLIATPTSMRPPRTFEEMNRDPDPLGNGLNRIYNLAGAPAISVPAGYSSSGLPIGVEFAGRPFAEATVYRLAHAYEQANPWHTMHPDLDQTTGVAASADGAELGVVG